MAAATIKAFHEWLTMRNKLRLMLEKLKPENCSCPYKLGTDAPDLISGNDLKTLHKAGIIAAEAIGAPGNPTARRGSQAKHQNSQQGQ